MQTDEEKTLNLITVKTNRLIHECYFLNAEKENKWRHQYFLYILNENNEVIPVMYPTNQDVDSCKEHLKKVEKIFKKASEVKICTHGTLKKMPLELVEDTYDFGTLGVHQSPYAGLMFDTICNAKECYGISEIWKYTCPNFKGPRP